MNWFLERISETSSEINFGSSERNLHTADFEKLIQLGILKQTHNLETVDCTLCDEPHDTAVRDHKGKLYYVCENGCGRKDLSDEDVAIFECDIPRLLSLFQQAIGIETPKAAEIINGVLWDLGAQSINRAGYQLFFSRNLSELSEEAIQKINSSPHPAVFYTGPSRTTLPFTIVPLTSCIKEVQANGIRTNHDIVEQHFPVGSYAKLSSGATQKTKSVTELVFPEKVQWEKVAIKIKEGLAEVEILYDNQHIKDASYIELGFYTGTKQQKPNREWLFLMTLSAIIATDKTQATAQKIADGLTHQTKKTINVDNVHGVKKNLDKSLQRIFQKSDHESAFYEYPDRGYYEPKFSLAPSPVLRQEEPWMQDTSLDEDIAYNTVN